MVVLGQYNSVLLSIKLYWDSKRLVCLYILEKVEIWSGDTDAWHTHRQQNIGLLSLYPVKSLSWVTQCIMKQALFCHRPMVIQHPIEKWLKKFFGLTKLLFSFDKIAFLFHKIAFLFKEVVFFIKKNCFFYSTSLLFIRQNCFLFLTKLLFYSTKCFFIQQNYSFGSLK